MNTLKEKARISLLPLLVAGIMLLLALGIVLAQSRSGAAGDGIRADLTTHQDGNPPPTCRPAGKYAGDPHPNNAACKHKPQKH